MKFTKMSYVKEKFKKLIVSKENLNEVEFEGCTFTGCSFVDSKFEKCRFIDCGFEGCILSAVIPLNSRFVGVCFTKSKVIGIDWTKAAYVQDVNFDTCSINYSNFRMLNLNKVKMVSCEAKDVDFTDADLSEGDLSLTDFESSIFSKTNLTKANFKGAKNYEINFRNNIIKKARFSMPDALSLLNGLDVIIE